MKKYFIFASLFLFATSSFAQDEYLNETQTPELISMYDEMNQSCDGSQNLECTLKDRIYTYLIERGWCLENDEWFICAIYGATGGSFASSSIDLEDRPLVPPMKFSAYSIETESVSPN